MLKWFSSVARPWSVALLFLYSIRAGGVDVPIAASTKTSLTPEIAELIQDKKYEVAIEKLNAILMELQLKRAAVTGKISSEPDKNSEAYLISEELAINFARGLIYHRLGQNLKAKNNFNLANVRESPYRFWSQYYLGELAISEGRLREAKKIFSPLLSKHRSFKIRRDSRLKLAEVTMKLRQWRQARRHYRFLERRMRGESYYPEILWNLAKIELKSKRGWRACRWARKLYSRYPGHAIVGDWGVDLAQNKIEGLRTRCTVSSKNRSRRFKYLFYSGLAEKATKELAEIRKLYGSQLSYYVDSLRAEHLLTLGEPQEALKILSLHYKNEKSNYNYMMLFARAAADAGEYNLALSLYLKTHNKHLRSRYGRKALFRAGFLSYQNQDYDTAIDLFEQFKRKYSRSGLTRDASWYVAWLKYLKKDYYGASTAFRQIIRKKQRRRRYWRSQPMDRLKYWLAQSKKELDDKVEAARLFTDLKKESPYSYYGTVSAFQLDSLGPEINLSLDKNSEVPKRNIAGESDFDPNSNEDSKITNPESEASESDVEGGKDGDDGENETEESSLADEPDEDQYVEEEDEPSDHGVTSSADFTSEEFLPFGELAGSALQTKNEKLANRFDLARHFISMGFYNLAKWELFEVERKTSNKEILNALMVEYERIQAFHRSSQIADLQFAKQRKNRGITGGKDIWRLAYPKAYLEKVESFSKIFNVKKEFIWSIVRAESHYRKDATSWVGAQGLMQVMPYTQTALERILSKEMPLESQVANKNLQIGSRYLKRLLRMFDQKMPLAAAGYNAGPHRVNSWLYKFGHLKMDAFVEHIPYVETRNYVKKVMKNYQIYNLLLENRDERRSMFDRTVLVGDIGVPPKTLDFYRENWESL